MKTWIILLKGVNVGGHRKLPMADFRTMLMDIGFDTPRTYIQSGNAIVETSDQADQISARVAKGILARFGFEVDVMVRSADAFQAAIAANPFPQAAADPKQLHLFFLAPPAGTLDLEPLAAFASRGEEFKLVGDVFYLFTPNGIGRSDLAGKLPRLIKTPMTGRNLRSCLKIAELAAQA